MIVDKLVRFTLDGINQRYSKLSPFVDYVLVGPNHTLANFVKREFQRRRVCPEIVRPGKRRARSRYSLDFARRNLPTDCLEEFHNFFSLTAISKRANGVIVLSLHIARTHGGKDNCRGSCKSSLRFHSYLIVSRDESKRSESALFRSVGCDRARNYEIIVIFFMAFNPSNVSLIQHCRTCKPLRE